MEKLVWTWTNAKAIGFFPEIAIFGLAIYFAMRIYFGMDKLKAIWWQVAINFLGQLYYDMPQTLGFGVFFHDLIGTIVFTIWQTATAIAVYSFLEAIKVIDIVKRFIDKKSVDAGVPPINPT